MNYPNEEQLLGYQIVIRNNSLEQVEVSHPNQKNQFIPKDQISHWMGRLHKGTYSIGHKSTIVQFYNWIFSVTLLKGDK